MRSRQPKPSPKTKRVPAETASAGRTSATVSPVALVGRWKRTTPSECATTYPTQLEFLADHTYRGVQDTPGIFSVWDVGRYSVLDAGHIKISTANDAEITYDVSIADDVLTFVDETRCQFQYQRQKDQR